MRNILNEIITSKRREKIDIRELEIKLLEILKNRKLTFPEIVNELNLENGERELLLDLLLRLVSEKRVKREKVQLKTERGINLTSRFFLEA